MAERLEISIDTARAQAALDTLGSASDRLIATLSKLNNVPGVDALMQSLNKVNTSALATAATGVDRLQSAINKLDASKLAQIGTAMSSVHAASSTLTQSAASAASAAASMGTAAASSATAFNGVATAVRNAVGDMSGLTAAASTLVGGLFRAAEGGDALHVSLGKILGVSPGVAAGMIALAGITVFSMLAKQAAELATALNEPTQQVVRLNAALSVTSGADAGAKALNELRALTKEVGGSVGDMIEPFTRFRVVTDQLGMTASSASQIFKGFQSAITANGLSAENAKRVFNALQQMMSKGTVQMEELKGQLGDALPGALDSASRSMGVTTAELMKMVEQGNVMAKDLLPRMSDELLKTWSGPARAQMLSFAGQMTALKNLTWELTLAFGSGGLAGASAGFATVLRAINGALAMPGMAGLTAAIGDLVAAVTALAGFILGEFLRGLLAVPAAIGAIYSEVVRVANAFGTWAASVPGLTAVVTGVGTSLGLLAAAIPNLIGLFVAYRVAIIALTAAKAAYITITSGVGTVMKTFGIGIQAAGAASMTFAARLAAVTASTAAVAPAAAAASASTAAMGATMTTTGVAVGGASTAFSAFLGVLRGLMVTLGPLVAAAGLVYLGLEKLGVIDTLKAKYYEFTGATTATADKLNGFAGTIQKVEEKLKGNGRALYEAATAYASYQGVIDRTKLAEEQYELQQIKNTAAMKMAASHLDERKAKEKAYQDTLKSTNASLQGKVEAEKRSFESSKAATGALSGLTESLKQSGGAATIASLAKDNHSASVAKLSNAIKANETAMNASKESVSRAQAAHESMSSTLEQEKAKYEEAKAIIKLYGVALTENQMSIAQTAQGMGLKAEEAGKLAIRIDNLTKSNEAWVASLNNEIAANQAKIANGQSLIAMLERELAVINQRNTENGKLSQLDQVRKGLLEAEIRGLKEKVGVLQETTLAEQVLQTALKNNIDLTQAAKIVFQQYGDQLKGHTSVTELAAGAQKKLDEQAKKTGEEIQKSGDQAVKSSKMFETLGTMATTAATWVAKLGSSFMSVTDPAAKAQSTLPQITTALSSLQAPISKLGNDMPAVGAAFEQISAAAAAAPSNIAALTAAFIPFGDAVALSVPNVTALSTAFVPLSTAATEASIAFQSMVATVPTLAEPMAALAASVKQLTDLGPSLSSVNVSIESFVAALAPTAEKADLVAAAVARADEAVKALDASVKANPNLFGPITSSIETMIEKIDTAITKFRELADAMAKASAGGGSGGAAAGGGGGAQAPAYRLGGMSSGGAPQMASVGSSTFNSAPALAKGISNTNALTKRASGGIPAILHPNEAVVPLPRGRQIPVNMQLQGGVELNDAVRNAGAALDAFAAAGKAGAGARNASVGAVGSAIAERASAARAGLSDPMGTRDALNGKSNSAADAGANSDNAGDNGQYVVNFNITTQDADSFKRSRPQIEADLYKALRRSSRQVTK